MIGDNLSRKAHRKLTLWGTVAILGVYLLCVVQARQWPLYSVICGPFMLLTWIWGLETYKRPRTPREMGRVANFGTPGGLEREQLGNMGGLLVRPDPHPGGSTPATLGGRSIQFDAEMTIRIRKTNPPPIVRVSRYKKISDPTSWVL